MNPTQLTAFRDEYTKLAAKKMSIKKMKELLAKRLFGEAPKGKSVAKGALKGSLQGAFDGARAGGALGSILNAVNFKDPIGVTLRSAAAGGALGGVGGGLAGALKARAANKSALKEFIAAKGAKKQEMARQAMIAGGAVGGGATLAALLTNKKGKK